MDLLSLMSLFSVACFSTYSNLTDTGMYHELKSLNDKLKKEQKEKKISKKIWDRIKERKSIKKEKEKKSNQKEIQLKFFCIYFDNLFMIYVHKCFKYNVIFIDNNRIF